MVSVAGKGVSYTGHLTYEVAVHLELARLLTEGRRWRAACWISGISQAHHTNEVTRHGTYMFFVNKTPLSLSERSVDSVLQLRQGKNLNVLDSEQTGVKYHWTCIEMQVSMTQG